MGAHTYAARQTRGQAWALLACLLTGTAQAELGGTLDSVYNDQKANAATNQATSFYGAAPATQYTQYTQRQADGVSVRQYVNAAGRVFAVAWDGPLLPDFQHLLGNHFTAYAEAQRQASRRISIQSAELVLDATGMMRSFSGRAYVPALLPPALSMQDIR